jgi:PLAT/LH2 domain
MLRRFTALAAAVCAAGAMIGLAAGPAAATQPAAPSAATARHVSGPTGPISNAVKRYYVITRTGDETWAGTDATVRIKVYGFANDSGGYINMDNEVNNFEPGETDTFGPFSWNDLGGVDFIGVHKDNNGSDWRLLYADVYDSLSNVIYHCPTDTDPSLGFFPDQTDPSGLTIWYDCP